MSDSVKENNNNIDMDTLLDELKKFAEDMHAKNRHRIKICLRCIMIVPLIFMVLMFTMDTAKVVYLLLWIISLFIFCAYLIVIDYIDDRLTKKFNEFNIEIQERHNEVSITNDIRAFLNEVKL